MQLNVLQFTVGEILFSIQRGSKSLQVTATSAEQSFDENFDLRVMETFQFMLARPLQWSIMIMQTSNSILTRIRENLPDVLRYQVSPPIALTIDNTEPFCDLFGGYLKHILEYHEGRLHPISANMRSICLASVGVIETKSLAICVAVESIVKLVNPKKYKLSSEEKDWIKKADEYFASWGGPEDLTKRITGLFSMLSQTSAKIRLQGLVDLDVITEDKVQAWSTLRNKLAHGEGRGSKSWQEFLTLSNTVLLLFYHLVFHALKYEGKYTDYSTLGWPLKTYQVISESKNKTTTNA
jgi:hypothetical protein